MNLSDGKRFDVITATSLIDLRSKLNDRAKEISTVLYVRVYDTFVEALVDLGLAVVVPLEDALLIQHGLDNGLKLKDLYEMKEPDGTPIPKKVTSSA